MEAAMASLRPLFAVTDLVLTESVTGSFCRCGLAH